MKAHDTIKLRPYQEEAIRLVFQAWITGSAKRPAIVLPTGAGKTVVSAGLIQEFQAWTRREQRVLFLAHRDELLDQTRDKIAAVAPTVRTGKVKAADDDVEAYVVVASVQTLSRPRRLQRLLDAPGNPIGLVIVDEVHHVAAESYQRILAAFPDAYFLGVTATLARGDGVGLGDTIDQVVYQRTVLEMVADGYLTDVRGISVDLEGLDLSTVTKTGGDYAASSLGEAIMGADGPKLIAAAMKRHAPGRRSVIFAPTVAVARAIAAEVGSCEVVSGETSREDRQRIYAAFQSGRIRNLANCMVLSEGWDAPWADCCVIARPTKSAPLFVQMVGRVLRPWQDKTEALVIDITGVGGVLSTLVDLAPGQVTQMRQGESLAEAYEEQEARANTRVEAGSLAFRLKHKELDLFTASSPNWLRTRGGVLFIPLKGGYIVIWPTRSGEAGHWDVWGVPEGHGKFMPMHLDLPLGTAQAWAETEARDNSQFSVEKNADWRRKKAAPNQIALARSMRLDVHPGDRAGDVSDAMNIHKASLKLDRLLERFGQ